MDKKLVKTTVNLRKSIATDYVPEVVNRLSLANDQIIFAPPGANPALPIQNSGIERNGGTTNLYIQNKFYGSSNFGDSRGANYPTQDGQLISVQYADSLSPSSVYLTTGSNKTLLGQVSPWGVNARNAINASDDHELTSDNTILTCKIVGSGVILNETDLNGNILNTRTTTFSILSGLPLPPYTSVNIVHQRPNSFSTLQEYILRLGKEAIFLKESSPTTGSLRYSNITNFYITQSTIYRSAGDSYVVFGTIDGKILSADRFGNYRYPDGTGLGLGPFNNGTVVGTKNIRAMTTFNKWLIVAGDTGRVGSFDGATWKNFDGSGFGSSIFDNQIIMGAAYRKINAMAVWGDSGKWIVFGGDSGRVGSYCLNDGWHYSTSSGTGPWLGASSGQTSSYVIGSGPGPRNITTLTYFKAASGKRYLFVGSDSCCVVSFADSAGKFPNWVSTIATNHGTSAPSFDGKDAVLPRRILSATTFNNFYVIGGDSGYIVSYGDSNGWRKYDGSGTGIGPSSNQTAVGLYNVTHLNTITYNSVNYLIAQGAGRMGTYIGPAGASWSGYNGTYVEGLYNSGDASHQLLGSQTIVASCIYTTGGDTYFVVAGDGGAIASFDIGNGSWKHSNGGSNGTANGPYNDGTAMGYQGVTKMLVVGTQLILIGSTRIASFDGSAWKNYNGGGSGVGPYDNNSVTGGYGYTDAVVFNAKLFVCGCRGVFGVRQWYYGPFGDNWYMDYYLNISSWNGSQWKYYSGGGPATNDGLEYEIGSLIVSSSHGEVPATAKMAVFGSQLVVFNSLLNLTPAAIIVALSYDGSNWAYPYNTDPADYPLDSGLSNTSQGGGTGLWGCHIKNPNVNITVGQIQTDCLNRYFWYTHANTSNGKLIVTGYDYITYGLGVYTNFMWSYDGSAFKGPTGSGSGTGPYFNNNSSIMGSSRYYVTSSVDYAPSAHYFVIGFNNKGIASWDGSNWKNSDGTGTGTGPYNSGTVINNANYGYLATVGALLIVAGSYYVGNWNSSIWTNYNFIGSGIASYPHRWCVHDTSFGRATRVRVWGNKMIFSGNLNAIFCYDISQNIWEQVYNNKNVPPSFFGDTLASPVAATQYKNLFIYCKGSSVNCYDGSKWYFGGASGDSDANGLLGIPISNTPLSSNVINVAIAYNNWLVVAGNGGCVASFDGLRWKRAQNTGSGVGCVGRTSDSFIHSANILSAAVYGNSVVFGGAGGLLASFAGNIPTNYNASGTGSTVLAGNGTIPITTANIYSMTNYSFGLNNYLVIAGGVIGGTGSYLAAWNGTTWVAYNATGTGSYALALNNFGTAQASAIRSVIQHGNYLVCGDSHGNVYSFDPYPYTSPTSNLSTWVNACGYCINASASTASYAPYADSLILTSFEASGRKEAASQLISAGGYLYVLGSTGKLSSWDGIANGVVNAGVWNNYQGVSYTAPVGSYGSLVPSPITGTGTYNNGIIQTDRKNEPYFNPTFFVLNSNYLMTGPISPFTLLNDQVLFPHGFTIPNQTIDLPQTMLAQVFGYKFENASYLYGITNCIESIWYSLNANGEIDVVNARYAVIQTSGGKSRALMSGLPFYSGNLNTFGIFGFSDFSSFTNYVSYPTLNISSPVIYQSNIGLGSVDIVLSKGGDTQNFYSLYAPQYNQIQNSPINIVQSNNVYTTSTVECGQHPMINAYGKLTNAFGLPAPIEYRTVWLNGEEVALSVAVVDGAVIDCNGTLLTNTGEFDNTYIPNISTDNTIITYRYLGQPVVIELSNQNAALPNAIQALTPGSNIYKLNTISPLNIVDVQSKLLYVSSSDYNGRAIYSSNKPIYPVIPNSTISYLLSAFTLNGRYSNGLDGGAKYNYISSFNSTNIYQIPGIRLPYISTTYSNYAIDHYLATSSYDKPTYLESILSDGTALVDVQKLNYIYVQNTVVPLALGYTYGASTARSFAETVFLAHDVLLVDTPYGTAQYYDGYLIGNTVNQDFIEFFLRGNIYLFDNRNIYLPTFNSDGTYAGKNFVAFANGLIYLGSGPILSYFLSSFDNSIYSFDGGQQLQKLVRFSRPDIGTLIDGKYSALNNELNLQTATQLIWIRDNVITMATKPTAMQNTTMTYVDTADAMVMTTETQQWVYSYFPLSGSTVLPITYQTAFLGLGDNLKLDIDKWWVTIYDPTSSASQVTITHNSFDESGDHQEVKIYNLKPSMFSKNGRIMLAIKPKDTRVLATSLTVSSASKIYLIDLTLFSSEDVEASKIDTSNMNI